MLETFANDRLSLTLDLAIARAVSLLKNFAEREGAAAALTGLFSVNADAAALLAAWQAEEADFGTVEIVPSELLAGYDGAYSAASDTILLSDALLGSRNLDRIADVLIEELGHRIDASSNAADTIGDEGAAFALLVRGERVAPDALADETGTLVLNGVEENVEFAVSVSDSGGFEGSSQSLTLESTEGGTIAYRYQHFTIPDRFIIRYDDQTLFDTGFTGGSSSGQIELPAGNSDTVEIRVATNDEGTAWNYDVTVETCPDPRPFIVESLGDAFVFDAGTEKCTADADITIGHNQGTNPLLRANGSTTSFDRNVISVSDAVVFATIGGVSQSLFQGGFEINTGSGTGTIAETGDGTFKLAGLDTEFKSITVLRDSLAFDVAFELPETAGGGYLVDTVRILDDALLIDSSGPQFRAGGRISLPDVVDFKLANLLEVEASDIALEYRAAEDALRFQSKLTLSEFAKLEVVKEIVADLSGDNYVQINSDGDVDVVGALKIATDLKLAKGWSLSEVELTLDTVAGEIGGSATIGMPFGLKIGGDATAKPSLEFLVDPFGLDAVGLVVDNLNKPIPSYPAIFFQGFNGKVDNFAPGNAKDIEFSGGLSATLGPQLNGTFLARLDGDVTIDAERIEGSADLSILNVNFNWFGRDLGTFTALEGNRTIELDWSKGQLATTGSLTALDGLYTLHRASISTRTSISARPAPPPLASRISSTCSAARASPTGTTRQNLPTMATTRTISSPAGAKSHSVSWASTSTSLPASGPISTA